MPNSRCIGTGAREGDIALTPGAGDAKLGTSGRASRSGVIRQDSRCENGAFLILFRLDVYRKPILEGP